MGERDLDENWHAEEEAMLNCGKIERLEEENAALRAAMIRAANMLSANAACGVLRAALVRFPEKSDLTLRNGDTLHIQSLVVGDEERVEQRKYWVERARQKTTERNKSMATEQSEQFQINDLVVYTPEGVHTWIEGYVWIESLGELPRIGAYILACGISVPKSSIVRRDPSNSDDDFA